MPVRCRLRDLHVAESLISKTRQDSSHFGGLFRRPALSHCTSESRQEAAFNYANTPAHKSRPTPIEFLVVFSLYRPLWRCEIVWLQNSLRGLQAACQRRLNRTYVPPAVERFTGKENRAAVRPCERRLCSARFERGV